MDMKIDMYDKRKSMWRVICLFLLFAGWVGLNEGNAQQLTIITFNGDNVSVSPLSNSGVSRDGNFVDLTAGETRVYVVRGTTTNKTIRCKSNNITIRLQGARITGVEAAIKTTTIKQTLNLVIDDQGYGDSYLKGATNWAAVQVDGTSMINISAYSGTSAAAYFEGGPGGAGIGGGGLYDKDPGEINIISGRVYATSTNAAAAIGGGSDKKVGGLAKKITISGGYVEAKAYNGGAAIGSGHGQMHGNITISGGTVYTQTTAPAGTEPGAGIGGGRYCEQSSSDTYYITISGGRVTGSYIGQGLGSTITGNLRIKGGSVEVTDLNKVTAMNGVGTLVYRVQTDALNAGSNSVQCSYTGSDGTFYTTASNGYFYFWMPQGTGNKVNIGDITNLTVPQVLNIYNNRAPLIFSNGTTKYYNLDALSNTGVSNLKLESSVSLYKDITVANNKTLDLNGKTLDRSGTNKLTLSGITLTLPTTNSGYLLANVQMTSNGLLKVDRSGSNNTITFGNVYNSSGTPCFLYEVTFPYGNLTNCVLKRTNESYFWQYAINNTRYIWLPSGGNNISLTTTDGTYFQDQVTVGFNYGNTKLTDRTTSFDISKGDVTVKSDKKISYNINNVSRTSENVTSDIEITGTSGMNSLTITADRAMNFKNASAKSLVVSSGTLKLLGSATFQSVDLSGATAKLNLEGATALNVSTAGFPVPLKSKILFSANSSLPTIKVGGKIVWFASIPTMNYGAISDIKQGTETLQNGHYTMTPNSPYCFWLNDSDADLTFSAGSPTTKYYYAETKKQHDHVLSASTYKAEIRKSQSDVVRYKDLATSFTAAVDGQTITLIDDMPNSTNENIILATGNPFVTFDLASFTMNGVIRLNANGGRLTLRSTGNGSLDSETTLSGLVYTEIPAANLKGTIVRNGNTVVRYMTNKVLANDKVTYSWNDGYVSDEAMMVDDKACLWLPKSVDLKCVNLGYSANMNAFKCGEITAVGSLSSHSANSVTVNPYVNIANSKVEISENSTALSLTYNGVNRTGFTSTQPITVYGTGTNPIEVRGTADVQHMTLKDLSIPLTASHDFPAIKVEGNNTKLGLYLSGKNNLKGGSKSTGVSAGINVAENATLAIYNDDSSDEQRNGTGQLIVKGGANIANAAPGIGGNYGEATGNIEIHGGTIHAEGGLPSFYGIGNGGNVSSSNTPVKIYSGSVDASREWKGDTPHSFVNGKASSIYLMTVNTGLTPNKKYLCTYYECDPEPFPVITDSEGKCYFWIPERTQTQKPEATFRDPATNNTTTIQLVKVDKNDKNVAPIVAELVQPGKEIEYHNNLKDAFDAVSVSGATIRLLIDIDNLATIQTVKTGYQVTLDLDRFNLDTKNSKEAGFIAETGGYLYVTGEGEGGTGNIKSTFKISGDIYIAGIVPLTDATPLLGDKAVFRTLINGLPDSPNNIYTYSYGSVSNRTFYLHDGVACLWLPDTSGELSFRVTQGNNVTDYTAGTITTNTQRTESMGCQAVGVIARVVKGETVRDFNNLPDAFSAAAETAGNEVRLLANVALTKSVTITGNNDFMLNLNGMGLTGATGTILTVGANRYLTITDNSTGTKGNVQMDMLLSGRLFVSGNVNLKGNVVSSSGSADVYLWRTMVDVSNLVAIPSEVSIQGGNTSKVLGQEGCYWLPKGVNQNLTFTAGGNTYPITGVNINDNHQDNLITLGIGNEEARITGKQKYDTFAKAWAAAVDGDEIVLLKDATIAAKLTLDNDRNIRVDVARYTLGARDGATIEVGAGTVLRINSSNGNGRMLVPVQNKGVLFIGSGIQSDRLTDKVTDTTGNNVWRALVSNLPDGMPDDGIYTFSFGQADPQTGSFYVSSQTACLWLKERKAERLTFPQFNSYTDNVTIEKTHANQVIWGQSNVAQVQNTMYTKLGEAFAKNTNQTVTLLKSAVLETTQEIASRMKLEMGGYSVSSLGSPASEFKVLSTGSLRITGIGSVSTNFRLDFSQRVEGSNANLAVEPTVNMSGQVSDAANMAYWRTTVTMPSGVQGELVYAYGTQTGKVTAVDGEPLTLWLTVPKNAQDIKLTRGQDSWIATSVKITGTHVNPVSVQYISDEARIKDGDYYKTLAEALAAAAGGQEVVMERDLSGVSGMLALGGSVVGTVGLDLEGKKLTSTGAIFDAGSARLVVRNGDLNGELQIRGTYFLILPFP